MMATVVNDITDEPMPDAEYIQKLEGTLLSAFDMLRECQTYMAPDQADTIDVLCAEITIVLSYGAPTTDEVDP